MRNDDFKRFDFPPLVVTRECYEQIRVTSTQKMYFTPPNNLDLIVETCVRCTRFRAVFAHNLLTDKRLHRTVLWTTSCTQLVPLNLDQADKAQVRRVRRLHLKVKEKGIEGGTVARRGDIFWNDGYYEPAFLINSQDTR